MPFVLRGLAFLVRTRCGACRCLGVRDASEAARTIDCCFRHAAMQLPTRPQYQLTLATVKTILTAISNCHTHSPSTAHSKHHWWTPDPACDGSVTTAQETAATVSGAESVTVKAPNRRSSLATDRVAVALHVSLVSVTETDTERELVARLVDQCLEGRSRSAPTQAQLPTQVSGSLEGGLQQGMTRPLTSVFSSFGPRASWAPLSALLAGHGAPGELCAEVSLHAYCVHSQPSLNARVCLLKGADCRAVC